jgi:hypothetical protein
MKTHQRLEMLCTLESPVSRTGIHSCRPRCVSGDVAEELSGVAALWWLGGGKGRNVGEA